MLKKNPYRINYSKNIELAYIISLVITIALVRFAANYEIEVPQPKAEIPIVTVEEIPQTKQGKRRPLPTRPAIPVPTEEEVIPEEETIEPIKFTFYSKAGADGGSGAQDAGIGAPTIIPPRPIAWVIPEYPEEDRKKGLRGEVKLSIQIDSTGKVIDAIVLENETGSEKCAQAAIRAALASRFIPAMKGGKPTSYWLIQPYRFDIFK